MQRGGLWGAALPGTFREAPSPRQWGPQALGPRHSPDTTQSVGSCGQSPQLPCERRPGRSRSERPPARCPRACPSRAGAVGKSLGAGRTEDANSKHPSTPALPTAAPPHRHSGDTFFRDFALGKAGAALTLESAGEFRPLHPPAGSRQATNHHGEPWTQTSYPQKSQCHPGPQQPS